MRSKNQHNFKIVLQKKILSDLVKKTSEPLGFYKDVLINQHKLMFSEEEKNIMNCLLPMNLSPVINALHLFL